MEEIHPFSAPQASSEPHISPPSSSGLIPSSFTSAQKWSSSPPHYISFQTTSHKQALRRSPTRPILPTQTQPPPRASSAALNTLNSTTTYTIPCENEAGTSNTTQNDLQSNYLVQNQKQSAQPLPRKRAPKSQTMSVKSWRPCEGRLKQLYVNDGKSIRELREIVNSEFGLTATERQYKAQIKKMNLKRNVKEDDQKAIVRRILHRTHAVGKNRSHVRVRGHKMAPEKISRWMKDAVTYQPSTDAVPPSPLPSYISIYTNSPCVSPKLAPMSLKDMDTTVMQRLLKYARLPKHTIESQEARAVFNDLQLILGCSPDTGREHQDAWNPNVEEDIVRIRNLMNMAHEIKLEESGNGEAKQPALQVQGQERNPSRGRQRYAAWMTPHGRVEVVFWTTLNSISGRVASEATDDVSGSGFAAQVAIIPTDPEVYPFRAVFDFTPYLNLSTNISFQAMIPNDSEVFRIVAFGQVRTLVEALENGTASLTDRDQEGRSLLNYAIYNERPDMCKFLVYHNSDVNAIEPSLLNIKYMGPIHAWCSGIDSESEQTERQTRAECAKIMLEAGADFSLECHHGHGVWVNTFMCAASISSFVAFKHILDFGEPFISMNDIYRSFRNQQSTPLVHLAKICGYNTGDIIDVVDKAILLLRRGADILRRDENGDTVLHELLQCERYHEEISKAEARRHVPSDLEHWRLSITEPRELLKVFITAGADAYATNNKGETPSMFACIYGRETEWIEALEFCGYDSEQVLAHTARGLHECSCERQTSKLSFQEFCQKRREHVRFEEVNTCNENDTDDQVEGSGEDEGEGEDEYEDDSREDNEDNSENGKYYCNRQCCELAQAQNCAKKTKDIGENHEGYLGAERTDLGMDIDIEGLGDTFRDEIMEKLDPHAVEQDQTMDRSLERMDIDFESSDGNEVDGLEDFFDFGVYAETRI